MSDQPTAREIQQAVVNQYGARARRVLESIGAAGATEACCTPAAPGNASAPQPIELTTISGSAEEACCGPDCCSTDAAPAGVGEASGQQYGSVLYPEADLSTLPESVVAASAGCGNPLAIAELSAGERVLDLGSGGGIDCFLAAQRVGEGGEVWGLDMTPDMVALARHNADQVGATNVRFRLGEIEDIPFDGGSFDAIMSNCVINLSHDKPRVFREAFRVLKPGGRLRVSDMVWVGTAPTATRDELESWAGCIAGALTVEDYLGAIEAAGFVDVRAEYEGEAGQVTSASVFARKP
ncbi:MAG: arsenite methyltransferase [Dehalococcoidia bacterium]|nr:arsenite methyltransferase [Dehalococcoidia bacterium]MCB9482553.1 arsenite methyltransferase [Dehalococcoidia bacterium]